ncbi:hypothetical protein AAVH_02525 [Aphelenchoides avenae]|nr:hypothetical protein AAVH_02525 [Aphelenchus avenae]
MLDKTIFSSSDTAALGRIRALPIESYYLQSNGRIVESVDELSADQLFQLHFRVCGGKGGFGSLLRSFRMHRSTNQLMCRDLSGRRLSDVKEEERLRRWIEKKAEREKEEERKKQEKYERLKNGKKGPKHEFADQDYLRKRDVILDQTEDAIEADVDLDSLFPSTSKRAKKRKSPTEAAVPIKVAKEESSSTALVTESQQEHISEPTVKQSDAPVAMEVTEIVAPEENKDEVDAADKALEAKAASEKIEKKAEVKDFPPVDLDQYKSSTELESLSVDHLKHALEARGLKCGGSLQERASRLFSVKGLKPEQYPKKIRANIKK